MSKIPNYVLSDDFTLYGSFTDPMILPKGSFITPVQTKYVPKHVLEDYKNRYFNDNLQMFCYTKLGMVAIPKNIIREV